MVHSKLKTLALGAALGVAALSVQAAPMQWTGAGSNGHWYEYIEVASPTAGFGFTWAQALAHAATRTHLGQTGYLASVTSQGEQDFINQNVTDQVAWLGGSDGAVEGTWVWQAGPEAGQTFFVLGGPQDPSWYSYWYDNEPNDCCGGEDGLQINWDAGTGQWNDHGAPSSPDLTWGYIVEFADGPRVPVPEPATTALLGTALLALALRRRRG